MRVDVTINGREVAVVRVQPVENRAKDSDYEVEITEVPEEGPPVVWTGRVNGHLRVDGDLLLVARAIWEMTSEREMRIEQ